ncbi:MAG: 3-oxoacyl-ACP reductase [Proteobacteria bacterium]|nr:3-oxoacyl-ACP reductase [Pseudomonadota bacterium]
MASQENRVAIVTGAGTGIGEAATIELYKDGYDVVLAGRRIEKLNDVIAKLSIKNNKATAIVCDVSDPNSVSMLFKETKKMFNRLDVLFNNAGISLGGRIEKINIVDWKKVVDINLNGMFFCTQEAFKIMKNQSPIGGRIINNGSISAHAPRPHSAPYTTTKHAVTGLTKSTSLDGREYNIACSQIDIGNALTPLAARMAKGVPQADGSIKAEAMMDAKKVGEAILQMANLPLDTNIQFMTIMATKMPYIGRG